MGRIAFIIGGAFTFSVVGGIVEISVDSEDLQTVFIWVGLVGGGILGSVA